MSSIRALLPAPLRSLITPTLLFLGMAMLAACGAPGEGPGEAGGPDTQGAMDADAEGDRAMEDVQDLPFVRQGSGEGGELSWTVPEEWTSVPPANRMRKAQYLLPSAGGDSQDGECVVFYFGPGQGGPPRANADRWASQFKDAAGNPPEPVIEESTLDGRSVMKVFVEGTYAPSGMMGGTPQPPITNASLLGAIVEGPDANWFFKCTGPAATMEAHRDGFDAMIASIGS